MNHQCIWMKSIIHINHVNLFWFYLFMKPKGCILENPKWLNRKPKLLNLCVYLSISKTNLSFTVYLKIKSWHLQTWHKSFLENLLLRIFFSFLTWFKPWSNELDSSWVLDAVLDARALESTLTSSKTWLWILCWS